MEVLDKEFQACEKVKTEVVKLVKITDQDVAKPNLGFKQ